MSTPAARSAAPVVAAISALGLMAFTGLAHASEFTEAKSMPGAIAGTMKIDFATRTTPDSTGSVAPGSPALGVADKYETDLAILNSVSLKGNIARQPWLPSPSLGTMVQPGFISYDLKCVLKNPQNPSQTVTLGNWTGAMKLDGNGRYFLAQPSEGRGALRIATDSIGKITGFTSPFGGEIQGRVPERTGLAGLLSRAAQKVNKTYVRYVDGKAIRHEVKGADPMQFDRVDLAQGPLAGYPLSRLTGSIDYDSEQGIWYVDVKAAYSADGTAANDRYSGTIRWNEDANRKTNGIGWYEVNVRLNEKPASEADAFAPAGASSEDAFFAADSKVPGFSGRINYVDTMQGDTVTGSKITYAVDATDASKIQTMNLAKILLLMVGPFNDE